MFSIYRLFTRSFFAFSGLYLFSACSGPVSGAVPPKVAPVPVVPSAESRLIEIKAPLETAKLHGSSIAVDLKLSSEANPKTLTLSLNGKNIGPLLQQGACDASGCKMTASVQQLDGLLSGKNRLEVSVAGLTGGADAGHSRFSWSPLLTDAPGTGVDPPHAAVEFATTRPGPTPFGGLTVWLQINQTVYPSNGNDKPCGSSDVYGVLMMDRKQLTELSYSCFANNADLNSYLSSLGKDGTKLVIVGTVKGVSALPRLNTSAIGGTNYSNQSTYPAALYPQQYMMVGVNGAAAGTAYEAYTSSSDPAQNDALMNGMLLEGTDGNYNFSPSGTIPFVISPNDSKYANNSMVTIGTQVYTAPAIPSGSLGGFWLLILDRVQLQPIDSYSADGCQPAQNPATCGTFFQTNGADPQDALAAALNGLTNRQLAILTTVGNPFPNGGFVQGRNWIAGSNLANALLALGGSDLSLLGEQYGGGNGQAYTLMSILGEPGFDKNIADQGKAVYSSTNNPGIGMYGVVNGILARNLHGLYAPKTFSQDTPTTIHKVGGSVDYQFYEVAAEQPIPWPIADISDTVATHVAAYHYLSNDFYKHIVTSTNPQQIDDIRALYASTINGLLVGVGAGSPEMKSLTLPATGCVPEGPAPYTEQCTWLNPVTNQNEVFTNVDFSAVQTQLALELQFLNQTLYGMQTGPQNLEAQLTGSDGSGGSSSLLAALIAAQDNLQADIGDFNLNDTSVSINYSNIGSLISSGVDLISAVVPEAPAALGILSAALNIASSLDSSDAFYTPSATALPNPDATVDAAFGDIAASVPLQSGNVVKAFSNALDAVYSDWGKLQQIGSLVVTPTTEGGWESGTQVASLDTDSIKAITASTEAGFLAQVGAQIFNVDYYGGSYNGLPNGLPGSYNNQWEMASGIGSMHWAGDNPFSSSKCEYFYSDHPVSANDQIHYPTSTYGVIQLFILGQNQVNNNTNDANEGFPSGSYVPTVNAGIPNDLLWAANGPFARESPTQYSTNQCDPAASDYPAGYQVLRIAWTQTKARVSERHIEAGHPVTVSAKVTNQVGVPVTTGTIGFTLNNKTLFSGPVDGHGQVYFTTAELPAGPHVIVAKFSDKPSPTQAPGSQSRINVTVNK